MSRRVAIGVLDDEANLLQLTRAAREAGLKIVDVFTPYAVHGLDEAMGLRPSRLPWICFFAAISTAGLKLYFEYWATGISWPLNIGGKPWNSLPAFVPVTFEMMVLVAGLTTMFAFLVLARLRPGKRPKVHFPNTTDDRFVLVVQDAESRFDAARMRRLFEGYGVVEFREQVEEI